MKTKIDELIEDLTKTKKGAIMAQFPDDIAGLAMARQFFEAVDEHLLRYVDIDTLQQDTKWEKLREVLK